MSKECFRTKKREEEDKKNFISRLNKIAGQVKGIAKMIEEDRYCDDVLIQLSAVDNAIKSLANKILDDHMHTCLVNDIQNGKLESVDEIVELFKKFQ